MFWTDSYTPEGLPINISRGGGDQLRSATKDARYETDQVNKKIGKNIDDVITLYIVQEQKEFFLFGIRYLHF